MGCAGTDHFCPSPPAAVAVTGLCQPGASAWALTHTVSRGKAARSPAVFRAVPPAQLDDFQGTGDVPVHSPIPCYGGCPLPASLPVGEHPCHAPRYTWCQGRCLHGFGSVQGRGEGRPMGSPGPVDLAWWISSGSAPSTPNLQSCLLSLHPSMQPSCFPTEARLIPP